MKILELHLEGFRGAPDGAYRFGGGDAPSELVVVTGDAGSGKTSFLEAIAAVKEAVGPYGGAPSPASCLRGGADRGRVAARWLLAPDERARSGIAEPDCVTSWHLEG